MFESQLVQRWKAEALHDLVIDLLHMRFGKVPRSVTKSLREIIDEKRLRKLNILAVKCRDLEAFRQALSS